MKTICGSCRKLINYGSTCECRKAARREQNKQKAEKNAEATKIIQSTKWRKFRKRVIERDNGHCQRCLIKFNIVEVKNLEVHHIKPRSKYPELTFVETNCITLCKICNTQLGVKETLDFKAKIEVRDDFVL